MKRIVVVTDFNGAVHREIERNLREVFEDSVRYEHVFLDSLKPGTQLDGDVVLFMLQNRADRFKGMLVDPDSAFVVSRTIKEDRAFRLLDIPEGSEVLLVNDCIENTLETVALMYRLRIKGLKIVPYEPGMDISRFVIAVTPGEGRFVPEGIPTVIDVGNRCLDGETMIKLVALLEMNNWATNKKLLAYINSTADVLGGIKSQYRRTRLREAQLNAILDMAHEGFMLISGEGVVLMHNAFIVEDMGWEIIDGYTRLDDLLSETNLAGRSAFIDELVQINDKWVLVTREAIKHTASVNETMMVFRDVTHIRQLESQIWEKTKALGQQAVYTFDDIVSQSGKMKQCIQKAKRFAANDLTVLIEGKSGTGKEMLAQSIHNQSVRSRAPFVAVNCAALPESLLESELFGYEPGAFTGARKEGKRGLFEQAHRGTIFLDEIGDMPAILQSRLLRVIQEKQIMRIGSDRVIGVDVRVIAATNKSLKEEVEKGRFREDLYYRINVLPLVVPTLQERKEDILLLFERFLDDSEAVLPISLRRILLNHAWEGNVRELENVANYYKLMRDTEEPYPIYLQLEQDADLTESDLVMEVLGICYEASLKDEKVGRERLRELMEERMGQPVSEYQIRKLVKEAVDKKLMTVYRGRQGCCLSEDGRKLVENTLNG